MAWVRIDDGAWDHPKQLQAGPMAVALWMWGLCYCSRHLTDGTIPTAALVTSGVPKAATEAGKLVAAGLWERADDAYVVHDYDDYNPSRAQVERRRKASETRLREWRKRRGNAHGNAHETPFQGGYDGVCNTNPVPVPVPVPQVPPNPREGGKAGDDDDAAAWLLNAYPRWYAEERSGAAYRSRPTLDWQAALGLTETWPDRAHLERMCRTFLRATNLPAAHANRSLEVFARAYASGCDAAVRQGAGA